MDNSAIYRSTIADILSGAFNFKTGEFKVMLVGDGYSKVDTSGHRRRSDVVPYEISGPGYQSGGKDVDASLSSTGEIEVKLGGAVWDNSTISPRGAVYYHARGGSAENDELVFFLDFERVRKSDESTIGITPSTLAFPTS